MVPISHFYRYYLGEYTSDYFMNNQRLLVTLIHTFSVAAGTQKEGQAQQFHKNPGDNLGICRFNCMLPSTLPLSPLFPEGAPGHP